ncbi:MAG: hypothetical protein IJX78_06070 [Bacilli bacterium]|nr:hypothetical protein [Bacilli bacterium]
MRFIAHRGCPKKELENTVESFIVAGCGKYYGIESDITLLKDGNMIIYHDDDLNRLAGINRNIRDLTLAEARGVVLNNRPTYHTYDYKITTPLEYIKVCKHYNKVPVIDIKWGFTIDKIDELIDILKKEEMYDKSIIICYTMDIVLYIKKTYPDFKVQFLAGMLFNEKNVEICLQNKIDLDVRSDFVTKELVDLFHSHGLVVNCWTVDVVEELERVIECGVDFVTTNVFEER